MQVFNIRAQIMRHEFACPRGAQASIARIEFKFSSQEIPMPHIMQIFYIFAQIIHNAIFTRNNCIRA